MTANPATARLAESPALTGDATAVGVATTSEIATPRDIMSSAEAAESAGPATPVEANPEPVGRGGSGGRPAAGRREGPGAATAPVDDFTTTFAERTTAVGKSCTDAIKPMAIIILVIGAGGAFKQVLVDSGVADYIKLLTDGWNISPIVLAWGIAALLRVALGSATVAVVTAAGVVLPLVAGSGVPPELMVLAVSCGSIFASHVNDPGFWLFKEFLNLSVMEAIKTRTSYTCCLSILGLLGVLAINAVVA